VTGRRDAVIAWWVGRTDRERWMLLGLGALLGALLFWYGLLQPLERLAERAEARHARAAAVRAEVGGLRTAIDEAQMHGADAAGDVEPAARASAETAGVAFARSQAGDDAVELWTEPTDAPALFGWLAALHAQGIGIRALEVHRADDGRVEARIALRGAGR